jgi:hypothetical protein
MLVQEFYTDLHCKIYNVNKNIDFILKVVIKNVILQPKVITKNVI